ncbi:response regulator transcription factor [Paenibacillus sp. FA6]|uniref:response regulator transcription factor n=1 Tax=Paenibacillus sp. FA6 TaxID=3413029 RepID=UPI003F65B56A
MNVLLVDDDFFVVAALEQKIDWKSLNIETVYTANNVAQARDILQRHPVQILISDIEMPQGSGLELLAWIREEKYCLQAIFLTNYADFNYAQKAIELQSFEYFLKPIEFDKMMLIIQKAIAKVKEQQQNEKAIQEGSFWQNNQAQIIEHFWRKLVSDSISLPLTANAIANSVKTQNLPYHMTEIFQPILINFFPYHGSLAKEENGLFVFALLNVLHELFHNSSFTVETIWQHQENNWILILKWKEERTQSSATLMELCSLFIHQANQYLKCDICCNVAPPEKLEGISQIIKQLLNISEEMAKTRNNTFFIEDYYKDHRANYIPPNLAPLEDLLNHNKPTAFLEQTTQYLKEMTKNNTLNTSGLSLFRLDILQLVYSFLKVKGVEAHKIYTGKTNNQLFVRSLSSIEDMEEYLKYLVNTAMEYRGLASQPKSIVEEMKQYIQIHYGDDLTRNDLAEIVYLHPDYLARIFKKETGISLGSYIIQIRILTAKHLLETTNLSIYTIASKVGYANYSHFSKIFKQEVGLTPHEYKKAHLI